MRITTKFIGSSAIMIALTAVLSGSSYFSHRMSSAKLNASYLESQSNVTDVVELELALRSQIAALNRLAVLPGDAEELARYTQARASFFQSVARLERNVSADDLLSHIRLANMRRQQIYLEKLAQQQTAVTERAGLTVALESDTFEGDEIERNDTGPDDETTSDDIARDDIEAVTRSLRLLESQLARYSQELLETAYDQTIEYKAQQRIAQRRTEFLGLLSFTTIILLLVAQYYGLLQPVVASLHQLEASVDAMGRSDGTRPKKVDLRTADELQVVAGAFNRMSDRLARSYEELETKVAERTVSLQIANQSLAQEVSDRIEAEKTLSQAIEQLHQAQLQLLQREKMSGLSHLVSGVAHEINNPASFIVGNLVPAQDYAQSLLSLLAQYQAEYPEPSEALQEAVEQADLAFIQADFPQLIQSVKTGAKRITTIVRSLQTFAHHDESETKSVDIHQGLDSALLMLSSALAATNQRPAIKVQKKYGDLPKVYCYPGQLNQVFMGLLSNAVDALSKMAKAPTIKLNSCLIDGYVRVCIVDNGIGMDEETQKKSFDPFFTTKPVGNGQGLGLSLSYQIITSNHKGRLSCESQLGVGTTFVVDIPLNLPMAEPSENLPSENPVLTMP